MCVIELQLLDSEHAFLGTIHASTTQLRNELPSAPSVVIAVVLIAVVRHGFRAFYQQADANSIGAHVILLTQSNRLDLAPAVETKQGEPITVVQSKYVPSVDVIYRSTQRAFKQVVFVFWIEANYLRHATAPMPHIERILQEPSRRIAGVVIRADAVLVVAKFEFKLRHGIKCGRDWWIASHAHCVSGDDRSGGDRYRSVTQLA